MTVYLQYEGSSPEPPDKPEVQLNLQHEKTVIDNNDCTYDLTLNITGDAATDETKPKLDVIFVLDVSGSMGDWVVIDYDGWGRPIYNNWRNIANSAAVMKRSTRGTGTAASGNIIADKIADDIANGTSVINRPAIDIVAINIISYEISRNVNIPMILSIVDRAAGKRVGHILENHAGYRLCR